MNTTYSKAKSPQEKQCSRCHTLNKISAGEMFATVGGQYLGKCCCSPHQLAMAKSLRNPPASALKMHPTPGAAEKYDGPTPAEIMGRK